jgi:hypothetical protein
MDVIFLECVHISRHETKIALRTRNTIQKKKSRSQPQTNKYNKRGIYQIKCKDCSMKYVGQTERTFKIRYKEHINEIKVTTVTWDIQDIY